MSEGQETKGVDVLNGILSALEPLPSDERVRIINAISSYYGVSRGPDYDRGGNGDQHGAGRERTSERVRYSEDLSISPKDFVLEKQPRTDVERIACLAFYLTNYRDTPHFKTIDLSKLNTEAAQPKFANATWAANNALKMGYLAAAAKGTRQISAAGEQFVRALPDREAARKSMDTFFKRKRTRKVAPKTENGTKL